MVNKFTLRTIEEIEKLEQAIRDGAFETPIWGMIG